LPSSTAQKPGDIVTALNGKTIEVDNTDAEGRLLLADALSYGNTLGLSPMIDVATLTGAILVTLGKVATGAFTNHQPTMDRLLKAASVTGEKIWQLPMYDEYKTQNASDVADVKNTGGRFAGSITAALFLAEFSEKTPWVHLDIAGTARMESTRGYSIKGSSGVPVRTLVQFVMNSARNSR
jgi:leucyl aminopeptidase